MDERGQHQLVVKRSADGLSEMNIRYELAGHPENAQSLLDIDHKLQMSWGSGRETTTSQQVAKWLMADDNFYQFGQRLAIYHLVKYLPLIRQWGSDIITVRVRRLAEDAIRHLPRDLQRSVLAAALGEVKNHATMWFETHSDDDTDEYHQVSDALRIAGQVDVARNIFPRTWMNLVAQATLKEPGKWQLADWTDEDRYEAKCFGDQSELVHIIVIKTEDRELLYIHCHDASAQLSERTLDKGMVVDRFSNKEQLLAPVHLEVSTDTDRVARTKATIRAIGLPENFPDPGNFVKGWLEEK